MNTRSKQPNDAGSALLIVMVLTTLLGVALASYLTLMRFQHASVVRSQAWSGALTMAEAGIEEALAQLNPSALLFTTNIDRGANGWTLLTDGMYHAPRRILQHGYYDVAISTNAFPEIFATGYVTIPAISKAISRKVAVTTSPASVYRGLMVARVSVDLKGNGVSTDSFDSKDPNYSTNGLYDPTKRKAGGDVASTEGIINVQNADIKGTLYTSPGGSYTMGPNGSVGDLSWPDDGGMQPGHYKNDFNMDFPDVLPPYQTGLPPMGGRIGTTNYSWILGNANYLHNDSRGAEFRSGDTILVTGAARMYVTGDFTMQGGSRIIIAPGASLQLYVGGANSTIATLNNTGTCATFTYFGLPSNKSITLTGNDLFIGSIYAPSANLTLSGGGNNTLDYQGACVVNKIGMNGHFKFHFDEDLRRSGPIRGFQITSWAEL